MNDEPKGSAPVGQLEAPATTHKKDFDIVSLLVGQFCHEIISRVIPGAVILVLYEHCYIRDAAHLFHESSPVLGSVLFMFSWLVGLTLEGVGFFPIVTFCLKSYLKNDRSEFLSAYDPRQADVAILKKGNAEKVLFRGMIIISGITVLVPPRLIPCCYWPAWLVFGCKVYYWGIIGIIIFGSAYYWTRRINRYHEKRFRRYHNKLGKGKEG